MFGNVEMKVIVLFGYYERNLKYMCMGGYMCMFVEVIFVFKDIEGCVGNFILWVFIMVFLCINCF